MVRSIISIGLVALISGCAVTGPVTATGTGAVATGGNAKTDVQVRIKGGLALGDKVAEEAAKSAEAYLKASPVGVAADAVKSTAVDKGVEAGIKKARDEGKEPLAEEVKELRFMLEKEVNHAVSMTTEK